MAVQHKYTTPVQVTENVARVSAIIFNPQTGLIDVVWSIGEEVGGVFTQTDTKRRTFNYDDLPSGLQSTFDSLEATALTFGENQGLYPEGSQEPTPA